ILFLAVIACMGIVPFLLRRLQIPAVISLLLVGILIGPTGVGVDLVGVNPYYENCLDCGSRWKTRSDLLPILVLAATAIVVSVIITAMVLAF
ncbi:MAG: hypothetical protein J6Y54_03380, partial [Lentisphaeria bacterium]|nr:hypothetical protein [Lentisphaeria bacterium]